MLVTSILLGSVIEVSSTNEDPFDSRTTVWTKAICNEENYCIDVIITCKDSDVIGMKPTGEGVYFSKDWVDPRSEVFVNEWC